MQLSQEYMLDRKRLQRKSIRYALFSLLLTLILLFTAGCSVSLKGNDLTAYQRIVNASRFENAQSVRLLSGRMYSGDLYCYLYAKNRYGSSEYEMYRISSSGSSSRITITLYTLNESKRCLAEGYLDLEAINSALQMHYESPLSGLIGLSSNFIHGGDHMFLTIVILIVALCLHGLLSSKASDIAKDKGYEKDTWFHMCFWLGPLSFIIISAMPDRVMRTKQDETNSLLKQLLEAQKDVPAAQQKNTAPAVHPTLSSVAASSEPIFSDAQETPAAPAKPAQPQRRRASSFQLPPVD